MSKYKILYYQKKEQHICIHCKKPAEQKVNGEYYIYCSSCRKKHKQYMKKSNKLYRERDNPKRTLLNQNRRDEAVKILGGKCVYCGCDVRRALQINHIFGGGYKESKTVSPSVFLNSIINNERLKKDLELACAPCNTIHYMKLLGLEGWKITWFPKSLKDAER